jgi:carboxypeptidase Q
MRTRWLLGFAAGALLAADTLAPEIMWKIRREETEHSQILRTLHYLTDVYGPRLTGSPQYKAAADWCVGQFTEWGLTNAHLEPWDFGHPGWSNERLSVHLVSPVKDALVVEALAWTPGTNGRVRGQAVQVIPPERPTQEQFTAWLDGIKGSVKGKVVLVGKHEVIPVSFNPSNKRVDDAEIRAQFDPVNPATPAFMRGPQAPAAAPGAPKTLTAIQQEEQLNAMLASEGALARVSNAQREYGQIRAFHNRTYDLAKSVPTVVMRYEDYGRITRILADGTPVELELEIENKSYPEGKTTYNVVAEIAGTDKKDEIVMLGGHLDSWHSATGATDNAIGVATMMEAVRILRAAGLQPRRTIRIALWSAEEQGLLGSKAYVKEHFGTFENPKPEADKFVAYFNIDSGTGRARGMGVFGPPESAAIIRAALKPFEDLGVVGATATKSRAEGGTDSTSFNAAGLAGIGIRQDPIEYGTHTWHTNLDTYERILPEDAQKSAIVIASTVYFVATRDETLPRFKKEEMPAPVAARATN